MAQLIGKDFHLRILLAITAGVFLGLVLLQPGRFLNLGNLQSISFQFPEFALLAMAAFFTILTGGIDLSIVGIALLSATAGCLFLKSPAGIEAADAGIPAAVALILLTGVLCGAANGLLITRTRLSPILATLGTMQLFTGLTVVLTGGTALYGFPAGFVFLGNGALLGFPLPLLTFLLALAVCAVLLYRTTFGYRIYLLGGNPTAARFAGIDNDAILLGTYALSGILSALSGLIMAARANSINADYGSSYLLLAILIAVLAGVRPEGGFGRLSGLLLAVLCLQFLSSGLNILRFSNFAKDLTWGSLLLLVMVSNRVLDAGRAGRSRRPLRERLGRWHNDPR